LIVIALLAFVALAWSGILRFGSRSGADTLTLEFTQLEYREVYGRAFRTACELFQQAAEQPDGPAIDFDALDDAAFERLAELMNQYFQLYHLSVRVTAQEARIVHAERAIRGPVSTWLESVS
jgi:hypothetical protein